MDVKTQAESVLKKEIARFRDVLALEINKAQWLEVGDIDKTARAQVETERLLRDLQPIPEQMADIFGPVPDPMNRMKGDPDLASLYEELCETVNRIRRLGERNRANLREQMLIAAEEIRQVYNNRVKIRGYHSGRKPVSRYLNGRL